MKPAPGLAPPLGCPPVAPAMRHPDGVRRTIARRAAWAATAVACACALSLVGCGSPGKRAQAGAPASAAAGNGTGAVAPQLVLPTGLVLLGEVHDNAAQHALRLRAFEALLATGARPALLLEQLDQQHQAAIDELRARSAAPDAAAVVAAAQGGRGWNWNFYKPFITLALQHRLPIVAVNVGSAQARAVMRDGLAAHGFDPQVPADLQQALAGEIEASHCGMVKADTAARMALAQVARDQQMARALEAHAATGAVLLAGNGHVRLSLGAPRWLSPAARERSLAIGVLEEGDTDRDYDQVVFTPVQPRPDPCEAMRKR